MTSATWRELIKRGREVDPLCCPQYGAQRVKLATSSTSLARRAASPQPAPRPRQTRWSRPGWLRGSVWATRERNWLRSGFGRCDQYITLCNLNLPAPPSQVLPLQHEATPHERGTKPAVVSHAWASSCEGGIRSSAGSMAAPTPSGSERKRSM